MNLNDLDKISQNFRRTQKMPVLFLGHGSPMNAIEENRFVQGFRNISKELPRPNAIVCISAHWYTNGTFVTAMPQPKTIHDFRGFPEALYTVEYPAKGDPALAKEISGLLPGAQEDHIWGLDHGAWSVLVHLFPEADIPVIQLSIDYNKPAHYHFELAQRLQKLRDRGILIIGSGNIIHNLRLADFRNIDAIGKSYDWAVEAKDKTNNWLLDGNFQNLIDYQAQGTALQYAVPTPDHYLPLIYTLGLYQRQDGISLFNDDIVAGSLSMTSVKIG